MKLIVNMSFLVARIGRYNALYFHLFWPRGSGANLLQCVYLHFFWADLWSSKFPLICQPSSFVVAFFLHSSVCIALDFGAPDFCPKFVSLIFWAKF